MNTSELTARASTRSHPWLRRGLTSVAFAALAVVSGHAQHTAPLGNTGATVAQEAFHTGLTALHNFQYLEAAGAFRRAQRLDPRFTLAYWGEAMTHSHPLWGEHDAPGAQAILRRLASTAAARESTAGLPHERALMAAAEALFAHDSLRPGWRAFFEHLGALYRQRPGDPDVAAFYGLSIVALAPLGPDGMRSRAPGVDVLERVFTQHPRHPGAAHYLIHAYDDVQHAALGLRAAETYAGLAPASSHAQHMPSHIFLPLGRWAESARTNQAAYDASVRQQVAAGWPVERRDWHALLWLSYSLAQQGRYARLEEVVRHFGELAAVTRHASALANHAAARAMLTMESGVWTQAPSIAAARVGAPVNQANVLIATAMEAMHRRDTVALDSIRAVLASFPPPQGPAPSTVQVIGHMVDAVSRAARYDMDGVLAAARRAAALEQQLPVLPGIPLPIKPAAELYGEALLQTGSGTDARAQFLAVLDRIPRRPLSLWGLARAQLATGDSAGAWQTLDELSSIWSEADPGSIRMERLRALKAAPAGDPAAGSPIQMSWQSLEGPVRRISLSNEQGGVELAASIGHDGVLLSDTGPRSIAPRIDTLPGWGGGPPRWIVNTHYHSDHVGGNAVLPAAARIAHVRARESLDAGAAPRVTPPLGPDAWSDSVLRAEARRRWGRWNSRFVSAEDWLVRQRRLLPEGPRLLVVNRSAHEVAVVDPGTYRVLGRIPTALGPHEVAAAPDGRTAFIPAFGVYVRAGPGTTRSGRLDWVEGRGQTLTIGTTASAAARHIELDGCTRPHGVAAARDRVWVTCEETGEVWELDAATGSRVMRHTTGQRGSHSLLLDPVRRTLWVANVGSGSVTRLDLGGGPPLLIPTAAGAEGLALSPDGKELWVANTRAASITIIDTDKRTAIATFPAGGRFPVRLAFIPHRNEVWVLLNQSNAIAIFDARSRRRIGTIDTPSAPLGIAIEPAGGRVFVSLPRQDRLVVYDASTRRAVANVAVGLEPDGVIWVPQ